MTSDAALADTSGRGSLFALSNAASRAAALTLRKAARSGELLLTRIAWAPNRAQVRRSLAADLGAMLNESLLVCTLREAS